MRKITLKNSQRTVRDLGDAKDLTRGYEFTIVYDVQTTDKKE